MRSIKSPVCQWFIHAATVGSSVIVAAPSAATPPLFSNQTSAAGVTTTHSTSSFLQSSYAGGGTVGDFNNDGWQDLFVFSGGNGNVPDRLFISNGDGTFTNQAATWGLTATHKGKSSTAGDFNNDGWLDLYVTSAGPAGQPVAPGQNKLYKNNGDGTFTNIAGAAGVHQTNTSTQDSWTSCFGDYDLDGDLDLFVGGFSSTPSNNGNRLFRNNGDETFTDVTASIGLFTGVGPIACLSCSFADMDGDRYPELLLGGDFKGAGTYVGSRYFKNDGDGTFTDLTTSSNTGHEENGMGQTLGDFNNDGKLDWYVTSIYGFPTTPSWTGNKLYRNNGNHQYSQYAATADCDDGGYGWGTVAVDFNHDGLTDLAETNGDGAPSGQYFNEQSYLWMNNGNLTFSEAAIASGFISNGKGRCLIHFDYDNDGDQDLALMSNNEPFALFRNDLNLAASDTKWLRVFLDTSKNAGDPLPPNGYGAKIYAKVGGTTYMRSIDGGNSFLGINELSAHFGLGSASIIEELRVDWPNGTTTILPNIAVNQTITVQPNAPCTSDVAPPGGDSEVNVIDLLAVIAGWGSTTPDLNGDGAVNVIDLLAIISAWGPC